MVDRLPGYLYGGTPVSSWDQGLSIDSLNNTYLPLYNRGRLPQSPRYWGSMSDGGGVSAIGGGGDNSRTNLIVNYLPQSMSDKDLYAMFITVGPIESCRVMKDYKSGYSYGFGFVNYMREEDAIRAIDTFNGYNLRNKRLKVSYARPSGEEIKETNLYVTNLPRDITEHHLETIFGKYGRIVQKNILRDKASGAPRGVAFVRYDKREEAQEAIAALNNVIPEGGTEPLCVKVAEEHGKQKAAYYAGWNAGYHQSRGNEYTWSGCPMMADSIYSGYPQMSPLSGHLSAPRNNGYINNGYGRGNVRPGGPNYHNKVNGKSGKNKISPRNGPGGDGFKNQKAGPYW